MYKKKYLPFFWISSTMGRIVWIVFILLFLEANSDALDCFNSCFKFFTVPDKEKKEQNILVSQWLSFYVMHLCALAPVLYTVYRKYSYTHGCIIWYIYYIKGKKVKVSPLQAMEAHGGYCCDIIRKNLERQETNKNVRGDRAALT